MEGLKIPKSADRGSHLHLGTSGWHYDHWRGVFYPPDLPKVRWLEYYAQQHTCVEINNSFYRFPSPKAIRHWLDAVPPDFRFALKVNRYITHQKRLKDCAEPLRRFLNQSALFGERLGPLLFQLPPRWRVNSRRLASFLQLLPSGSECAFEFRDPSWHTQTVYDLLAARGLAFCQFEIAGIRSPDVVTANRVYVRLHGPGPEAYRGSYPGEELTGWASRIRQWLGEGREVWLFFDNDEAGYAVQDARRISGMLDDFRARGR